MNLRNSVIVVGVPIFNMADVFSGSARMPCSSIMCPKTLIELRLKAHLPQFRVILADGGGVQVVRTPPFCRHVIERDHQEICITAFTGDV